MNFKVVPNTGDKIKDIKQVVDEFWDKYSDARFASDNDLVDFVITVSTIIDRIEPKGGNNK